MTDTDRLVILAGGVSSRMARSLGDASTARAKGMLGVGETGRPFLDYLLYNAREAGLRDLTIVVGENSHALRNRYGLLDRDNEYHGLRIAYAVQKIPPGREKPLGTAHALQTALELRDDWADRYVLVCNSDNLYSVAAFRALRQAAPFGAWIDYDIDGLNFSAERIAQFGITVTDEDGYLRGMIEKPSSENLRRIREEKRAVRVSMNLWRVHGDTVLPYLAACPLHPIRDEMELPLAIGAMVQEKPRTMRAIPRREHVPDLTSAADFEAVNAYLKETYTTDVWDSIAEK